MDAARARFEAWVEWSKLSDKEIAERLGCDASYPRKLRHDRRRPGLDVAHAIERVTAQPNESGERWAPGPIRTEEWLPADETTDTDSPSPKGAAA